MFTAITLQHSSRQISDLDFIVALALASVGLALTALAFALGFGAKFGQILAVAG